VSVLTGNVRLWQVVVLALLFGTLSAVDNPARQAFVREVVGHDLVRNAVTLNSTTVNVARVIGPTIAAILISTIGIGWCFIVNAVSFMFVIASLLALDAAPCTRSRRCPGLAASCARACATPPASRRSPVRC
jgi:MFS family permease